MHQYVQVLGINRQLESFMSAASNITTQHVLNFLSSSYDRFASYSAIVPYCLS